MYINLHKNGDMLFTRYEAVVLKKNSIYETIINDAKFMIDIMSVEGFSNVVLHFKFICTLIIHTSNERFN